MKLVCARMIFIQAKLHHGCAAAPSTPEVSDEGVREAFQQWLDYVLRQLYRPDGACGNEGNIQ